MIENIGAYSQVDYDRGYQQGRADERPKSFGDGYDSGYNKALEDAVNIVKSYFIEAIENGADIFSSDDKDVLTYNKHINQRISGLKK